jgi:hypothetical protein
MILPFRRQKKAWYSAKPDVRFAIEAGIKTLQDNVRIGFQKIREKTLS